jgi:DNA-binding CsgD family transcriptional regulator/PAS domain-containing protein
VGAKTAKSKTLPADIYAKTADGVYAVDSRQRIVYWSPAAQQILGWRPDEVVGKHCYDVIAGGDYEGQRFCRRNCPTITAARRAKPVGNYDVLSRRKDAADKVIDTGELINDLLSEPGETLTKKGIEKFLEQELKDKLEGLGIDEGDVDDIIGILTDRVFERLKESGQVVEEFEAAPPGKAALGPPTPEAQKDLPPTPTPVAAEATSVPILLPTATRVAETATAKDGSPVWLNISIILPPEGGRNGICAVHVFRDVSDRRRSEQLAQITLETVARFSAGEEGQVETKPYPPPGPPLTQRELEVLRLLASGVPTEDIAAALGVSRSTARNHIESILAKLGVHSRLQAVVYASRHGLI